MEERQETRPVHGKRILIFRWLRIFTNQPPIVTFEAEEKGKSGRSAIVPEEEGRSQVES